MCNYKIKGKKKKKCSIKNLNFVSVMLAIKGAEKEVVRILKWGATFRVGGY